MQAGPSSCEDWAESKAFPGSHAAGPGWAPGRLAVGSGLTAERAPLFSGLRSCLAPASAHASFLSLAAGLQSACCGVALACAWLLRGHGFRLFLAPARPSPLCQGFCQGRPWASASARCLLPQVSAPPAPAPCRTPAPVAPTRGTLCLP